MLDFSKYELITFDCYGTLIDWETGILNALNKLLETYKIKEPDSNILKLYARLETEIESEGYIPYRQVLEKIIKRFTSNFSIIPTEIEIKSLGASLGGWQPFDDTFSTLKTLKRKYKLGIISNIDNDLFAISNRVLKIEFDYVVTAEDTGAYKPSEIMFKAALKRTGKPIEKILHVAQSIYHDHIPAKRLGFDTVWIDRRSSLPGSGATPEAIGSPDMVFPDLNSFVKVIGII